MRRKFTPLCDGLEPRLALSTVTPAPAETSSQGSSGGSTQIVYPTSPPTTGPKSPSN